jgi:hypothetical protein
MKKRLANPFSSVNATIMHVPRAFFSPQESAIIKSPYDHVGFGKDHFSIIRALTPSDQSLIEIDHLFKSKHIRGLEDLEV